MNWDFSKINSTRLQSLEVNVASRLNSLEIKMNKVQEQIRSNRLVRFQGKDIYLIQQNDGFITDKYFGNEILLIDIEEDFDEGDNGGVQRQCSGMKLISTGSSKPTTPTFLFPTKYGWMYYFISALVYIICGAASVYFIVIAYTKWQTSPVVQATSNSQVHIKNIPYPAVTFCWLDRFRSDYDFLKSMQDCIECENNVCKLKPKICNDTELTTLAFAHQMCGKYSNEFRLPKDIWTKGYIKRAIDGDEFNKYREKLFPPCDSDWLHATRSFRYGIRENITRCNESVFQQFYSGIFVRQCMTFNSLRHKDIFEDVVVTTLPLSKRFVSRSPRWSYDNMMEFNGSLKTEPIYGLEAFVIFLYQQEKKYEKLCRISDEYIGSLMIHSPNEIPLGTETAVKFYVHEKTMLQIAVEPKITQARSDLEQYPPHQRGCLFSHEKKLTMFKFYTKAYCDLECLVEAFVNVCGCVPFQYPRQNSSVKVCTFFCPPPQYFCDCLPDCNSLSYEIKTQEAALSKISVASHNMSNAIVIMFLRNLYYTDVRYSITTLAEFFTLSLGVLGGFLGVSVTCVWHLLSSKTKKLQTFFSLSVNKKVTPSH